MTAPNPDDSLSPRRRMLRSFGAALAAGGTYSAGSASAAPPALATAPRRADFVNAFDFMSPDKVDAVAGRRPGADVTQELQVAISASPFVWLPDGTYRLSRPLTLRADSCLQGQSQRGVRLVATNVDPILEFPYLNMDCALRNLSFSGTGATAISVAATEGPFKGYLIRTTLEDCHFDWGLAYGINADLIYARVERCSFGYYGEGKNPQTLIAIRSYNVGSNYTNLNTVRHCIFSCGTDERAACELNGGLGWGFYDCDWSHAGMAVRASNIHVLLFDGCWLEGNTARSAVVQFTASDNVVEFRRCIFQNNKVPRLIQWSSKSVRGLSVSNCNIALAPDSAPVYDESTDSYRLHGAGKLDWRDNSVSGGRQDNSLVTGLNTGGLAQPRGWAVLNADGRVAASSDPGLRSRRNAAGDITLNLSNPGASAAETLCVIGTGRASSVRASAQGNPSTLRVRCVDGSGQPVEDVVNLVWFGA